MPWGGCPEKFFLTTPVAMSNYLPSAANGVHVAHFDAPWIVGVDTLQDAGLVSGADDQPPLPDLSLDPTEEPQLLSVINVSATHSRSFFVTVGAHALGGDGLPLEAGFARDDEGATSPCVTLILTVAPRCVMDVCYLPGGTGDFGIHSDIKDVKDGAAERVLRRGAEETARDGVALGRAPCYMFPLRHGGGGGGGRSSSSSSSAARSDAAASDCGDDDDATQFVCSQGVGGAFTHFFAGTRHALDFRCDVGTPVVAVADGAVRSVQDANRASGIHVNNLFQWNSVQLALDDGNFAEYVHIAAGSVCVAMGERVRAGQQICASGDVGFCPEPHLHFCVYASDDKDAPTIPFALRDSASGEAYVPVAGTLCAQSDDRY